MCSHVCSYPYFTNLGKQSEIFSTWEPRFLMRCIRRCNNYVYSESVCVRTCQLCVGLQSKQKQKELKWKKRSADGKYEVSRWTPRFQDIIEV